MMVLIISICSTICPVAVGSILGGKLLNCSIAQWYKCVYFCTSSMGSNFSKTALELILSSAAFPSSSKCPASVILRT